MKTLNEIIKEQIQDIKNMLDKIERKYKTQKQQEATYKALQQIQNKLSKM